MKSARILEAAWLTDFDRRPSRHRKHRSMQFSECLPADGIGAAVQNGSFGLSCGAALLPSYTNTLVAGRRAMSPNLTTRKALGGAATATAILVQETSWSRATHAAG